MTQMYLNGKWKAEGKPSGKYEGEAYSLMVNVPGDIALDLSEQGYISKDLLFGMNIKETEELEKYDWCLTREFELDSVEPNAFLCFRGVDCFAEYYVNDQKIGESHNAFISHEFDVTSTLKKGKNRLMVKIFSPKREIQLSRHDLFSIGASWNHNEAQTIRRPPHSFGWDIMPRCVSSGIWRDVVLEFRDAVYFSQFYIKTDNRDYCKDYIRVCYELAGAPEDMENLEMHVHLSCGDSVIDVSQKVNYSCGAFNYIIDPPKKWWPCGYGEPNIYDGKVSLYQNGKILSEKTISIGFRHLELDRTEWTDGKSGRFCFRVNNTDVMAKGVNWVPLSPFHSQDKKRLADALQLLLDSGANMVRCWGGNVYEDHEFFDFCDRHGIMVWQDFAMACNQYPENETFIQEIEKEATYIVREYRQHPSIAVFCGDNEIDTETTCYMSDPNENVLTRKVLSKVVRLNDMDRPYLPSSPYMSQEAYRLGKDNTERLNLAPEAHLWNHGVYFKDPYFKDSHALFVSETGYLGCPCLESIQQYISKEKLEEYHSDEWVLHSSDQNNNNFRIIAMEKQVEKIVKEKPADLHDFVLASQISQAEADKYFVERIRLGRPYKCGILLWNLLDGWPQSSDALVDYFYRKKIAYYYVKRAFAPFYIAINGDVDEELSLVVCNDCLEQTKGWVKLYDAEGQEVLYEGEFLVEANQNSTLFHIKQNQIKSKMLIMDYGVGNQRYRNHYLCASLPIDLKWYKELMEMYQLNQD